ncbi:MAG: response regulator transcription factor [Bacilli bacterium]|nr:response regulator transcription factor [Bacilli bacterium]
MRILLAEDEYDLRKALEVIFKHNNYSIDLARNGIETLEFLEDATYDAIILDIMMPKMDGLTALKKIREKGITTPVLMLTAKSQIEDRVIGLDSGADDYLSKPFASKELLARVRALTRRTSEAMTSSDVVIGNIKIDTANFVIKGPSGEVTLINKEYQMLIELVKKPGNVISVEKLLDKVWGYDNVVYDDVVWVNISNLRKKLRQVGSNMEIKTKRHLGYYVEVSND